jgi:uncharacterized protein (TIGR03067 family)
MTKLKNSITYLPCIVALLMVTSCSTEENVGNAKSDKELIQGTWEVVSSSESGREAPFDGARFIFTVELMTLQPKDATDVEDMIRVKYTLDPTRKPKSIDTSHELEPGKPIIQLGIYSLKGDTLELCLEGAGQPRPIELGGETGIGFILKRTKRDSN